MIVINTTRIVEAMSMHAINTVDLTAAMCVKKTQAQQARKKDRRVRIELSIAWSVCGYAKGHCQAPRDQLCCASCGYVVAMQEGQCPALQPTIYRSHMEVARHCWSWRGSLNTHQMQGVTRCYNGHDHLKLREAAYCNWHWIRVSNHYS